MKISQFAEMVRIGFDAVGLSDNPAAQAALEEFLDKVDYLYDGDKDSMSSRLEVVDMEVVVRGTNVRVSGVVGMIVDGYTWSDVLREYPEIEEDDLRACLQFATANDVESAA